MQASVIVFALLFFELCFSADVAAQPAKKTPPPKPQTPLVTDIARISYLVNSLSYKSTDLSLVGDARDLAEKTIRDLATREILDLRGSEADLAVPLLFDVLLMNRNSQAQTSAAFILGRIKTDARLKSVPALTKALSESYPPLQIEAAGSLGLLGKPDLALPVLIKALEVSDYLQNQVVRCLADMGPLAEPAVPHLLKALEQTPYFQFTLIEALGKIGPGAKAAVPVLLSKLKDSSPFTRADAAKALVYIDRQAAKAGIPVLVKALDDFKGPDLGSRSLRKEYIRALGEMGRDAAEAVPALTKETGDPDPDVRSSATEALSKIRQP